MASTIHDLSLFDGTTTIIIRQLSSKDLAPGNTIERAFANGSINSFTFFVNTADRRERFTTNDLVNAITAISPAIGVCIDAGTIISQLANRSCNGITAGANHMQALATRMRGSLRTLRAQQDQMATVDGELIYLSSDGYIDPVAMSIGNSLIATGFTACYRLSKVIIGGTQLTGVKGVTVNFGQAWEVERFDGHVYGTQAFLMRVEPFIDITFINEQSIPTLGLFGSIANATVYFQKMAQGGTVVAPATAEHVAISFGTGIKDMQSIGASGTGLAEPTLRLHGHVLTASTTSAIP